MDYASSVKPDMEIVGADGVHVGIVDHLDGDRIKLKRKDPEHGIDEKFHRYIPVTNIASTESGKIWLSAKADLVAVLEEENKAGRPIPL